MKYFKVWSEYDLGDEENPNTLYVKADNISKVHRYLENYCCSVGLEYDEELEDGMFSIEEIGLENLFIEL